MGFTLRRRPEGSPGIGTPRRNGTRDCAHSAVFAITRVIDRSFDLCARYHRLPSGHRSRAMAPTRARIERHVSGPVMAADVYLDFESAPIVERLEYPLLVNALVELALARPVLDPVVRATRNLVESRIARQPEPGIIASPAPVMHARTDMTPYLLVLATLLLLWAALGSRSCLDWHCGIQAGAPPSRP